MKTIRLMLALFVVVVTATSGDAGQTVRLNRVMRDKLAHSQKILEAVVTSNWSLMEQESLELRRATQDPAWQVLMTPEYLHHTSLFTRALDYLTDAAHTRDLEGAPAAYIAMTTACVDCHRYVARKRMAMSGSGPGEAGPHDSLGR